MAHWLATTPNYLLILDNADDPDTIRKELPKRLSGKLLLTSRASYFPTFQIPQPLRLKVMQEDEAIGLFRKLGLLEPQGRDQKEMDSELAALKKLAEKLEYLPLALSQAAAYCLHRRTNIHTYLKRYRERPRIVLEQETAFSDSYTKTVYYTWLQNFEAISHRSSAAAELLRYASFLAPAPLPEFLFLQGASQLGNSLSEELANETGDEALETMLTLIADYSLLEREPALKAFSLHRLVQQVQKATLSEQEQKGYQKRAIAALEQAYPGDEFEHQGKHTLLLPHWNLYTPQILKGEYTSTMGASLLAQHARYLRATGRYAEALPLYEQALERRCSLLGEEHPDTLTSLNNLALCLNNLARGGEAIPLYEQALERRRSLLGEEHPDTLTTLNNLAACFNSLGRVEQALPLYEQAYQTYRRAIGEEHPDALGSLNNLAACYYGLDRAEEALPLYEQALSIKRHVLGEEHPSTLNTVNNLAACYYGLDRAVEALPLYEQAYQTYCRVIGEEHPSTLKSLHNLAACLNSLGRAEEALPLHEQAYETICRVLGKEHPSALKSLNNQAICLRSLGHAEKALSLHKQAYETMCRVLGETHPSTLKSLNDLVICQRALGLSP